MTTVLDIAKKSHEFAKMCIRHNVPILVNNIDRFIKDKFQTHSLQDFTRYVKNKNFPTVCRTLYYDKLLCLCKRERIMICFSLLDAI